MIIKFSLKSLFFQIRVEKKKDKRNADISYLTGGFLVLTIVSDNLLAEVLISNRVLTVLKNKNVTKLVLLLEGTCPAFCR